MYLAAVNSRKASAMLEDRKKKHSKDYMRLMLKQCGTESQSSQSQLEDTILSVSAVKVYNWKMVSVFAIVDSSIFNTRRLRSPTKTSTTIFLIVSMLTMLPISVCIMPPCNATLILCIETKSALTL